MNDKFILFALSKVGELRVSEYYKVRRPLSADSYKRFDCSVCGFLLEYYRVRRPFSIDSGEMFDCNVCAFLLAKL